MMTGKSQTYYCDGADGGSDDDDNGGVLRKNDVWFLQ